MFITDPSIPMTKICIERDLSIPIEKINTIRDPSLPIINVHYKTSISYNAKIFP